MTLIEFLLLFIITTFVLAPTGAVIVLLSMYLLTGDGEFRGAAIMLLGVLWDSPSYKPIRWVYKKVKGLLCTKT